ncbi:OmpA family protein [Saccharospirillum salsuginis]|uniref:Flagellar motor protein MotD n=1 Tax=Saccharospirillum salsuginis TaxID=418750 RepID=A0A918K5Q6_9GAMM|nr:OmpA family protein [Saccharospirillum salsuginis]GGX50862.1 flagellar motor protein MotD [Saccharospirillum salsuginis]
MKRRRRRQQRFEGSQQLRWMISYADFLTLLFAFFAFLYAISNINEEKFRNVSRTLLQIFDVEPSAIEPIELEGTPQGPDLFNPLYRPEPIPSTREDLADTEPYHQESTLLDIRQRTESQFQQLIQDQLISVSGTENWLEINLQEPILFSPGSADITDEAEALLYEIAKILAPLNNPVAVEGYTDQSPAGGEFDTNWELSAMRAANVVRYLQQAGVSGQRLSAVGFGEFQPQFDETNPVRAERNRRVSIVVTRLGGPNILTVPGEAGQGGQTGPEFAEP